MNFALGTRAMTSESITQFSLCPACAGGRLHPYELSVDVGMYQGICSVGGWVVVCRGAKADNPDDFVDEDRPPCGFHCPVTPTRALTPTEAARE